MSTITKDNDQTFNSDVNGIVNGTDAPLALGDNSVAVRTTGNVTTNRNISGAVGNTSGSGNTVLGAGAVYVESMDAATVGRALNFGSEVLASNTKLVADVTNNLQTTANNYKDLAESSQILARDTLASALNSPTLAAPAATKSNQQIQTERIALVATAILAALWLFNRRK